MQNKQVQNGKPPKKSKANFANAINLNAETPIPIQYGSDSFAYNRSGKRYIPFIGDNDNFAGLLLEARLTSPTQNECIKTISDATIGNGIAILGTETPVKEFTDWLKIVNNKNQSFDKVMCKSADGICGMGNKFIEIVRGKVADKKYLKIYVHSVQICRLGERDTDGNSTTVIISKSFAKKGYITQQSNRVELPLYNPNHLDKNKNWKKMPDGTARTVIHLKNEVDGYDDYGLPPSASSLRWQVLEGKGAQYNLDMFANNLVMSGALVLNSAMTPEEAQANAQTILSTHTGDGKQGRIAIISSENGIEDFEFIRYETQKEGSFTELDKLCEKKIVTSNGWASEFISTSEGALGKGEGYLRSLWDLKETTTLKPLRKKIIEDAVKPIAAIWADWYGKPEVANYEFKFKSNMPFSFMGELKPEHFMQTNEARTLAGLEEDEAKSGQYISDTLNKKKDVQN